MLDEQSNKSLAKPAFLNHFNINDNSAPYTMKTCSGVKETSGRRVVNFMVESIDGHMQLTLPTLIDCDMMPDDRPCRSWTVSHHFAGLLTKSLTWNVLHAKDADNDQVKPSPPLEGDKEHWYLSIFGVHYPQKPEHTRVVFDSSAKRQRVSLNNVLLSGPDLKNTLLGVLMRFRKDCIALTADV